MLRQSLSALLATSIPVFAAGDPAPKPLVFSAVGCGPYVEADWGAARHYLARENEVRTSQFLVHLGDINAGAMAKAGKLNDAHYAKIKSLLTTGNTIPTYIVPGDNEWNDRPDPDVGWAQWTKHLHSLEKNFETKWDTARQEKRSENFAFVVDGVLVIGINLPGGRIHDHAEWMG
ncbi:MAG: hypothetical protein GY953_01790, partial [bacterium]|nr:hypothetical protein [bacterium]